MSEVICILTIKSDEFGQDSFFASLVDGCVNIGANLVDGCINIFLMLVNLSKCFVDLFLVGINLSLNVRLHVSDLCEFSFSFNFII